MAVPPGDSVTEEGLKDAVGPLGLTDVAKLMVPEKLLTLVRVMVVVPCEP